MSAHTPGLTDEQCRKALLAIEVHDQLMAINAELLEALECALPVVRAHGLPYTHGIMLSAIAKAKGRNES